MEELYIIEYQYPALSYLPGIGRVIDKYVRKYDYYTIPYDQIDNLVNDIIKYQNEYINNNKRLKAIEILKNTNFDTIEICTPIEDGEFINFLELKKIQGKINNFKV